MTRQQRIERYLRDMPDAVREQYERVRAAGFDPQPTGSRLFCPEAKHETSDWDLHFIATDEWINTNEGWSINTGSPTWGGASLKRWQENGVCVNLIAHVEPLAYETFAAATAICAAIGGPTEKGGRVQIFERIRNEHWTLADLRPFADWQDWPQEESDLLIAADAWEECGNEQVARFLRNPLEVIESPFTEEVEGIPF